MKKAILYGALLTASGSAQENGLPQQGINRAGFPEDPEGLQVFEEAGRRPNATSSIKFDRVFNNKRETWTWRINISEVAVPDPIDDIGKESANYSKGLHVASTQWQLEWPGEDETLNTLLVKRNVSVVFDMLILNLPVDITDQYNTKDSGNCGPILGEKCVESIQSAVFSRSSMDSLHLEGCEGTLNAGDGDQTSHSSFAFYPLNRRQNLLNSSISTDHHRGSTLFFSTSQSYENGNLTEAKSALQMLIMDFREGHSLGKDTRGESSGPTVLRQIVGKAAANESDLTSTGKRGTTFVSWRYSIAVVLGTTFLSGVIIRI